MTRSVEQIRAMLDAQEAHKKAARELAEDRHRYRRIREMPNMLEAARKKLAMLENECVNLGLDPATGLTRKARSERKAA